MATRGGYKVGSLSEKRAKQSQKKRESKGRTSPTGLRAGPTAKSFTKISGGPGRAPSAEFKGKPTPGPDVSGIPPGPLPAEPTLAQPPVAQPTGAGPSGGGWDSPLGMLTKLMQDMMSKQATQQQAVGLNTGPNIPVGNVPGTPLIAPPMFGLNPSAGGAAGGGVAKGIVDPLAIKGFDIKNLKLPRNIAKSPELSAMAGGLKAKNVIRAVERALENRIAVNTVNSMLTGRWLTKIGIGAAAGTAAWGFVVKDMVGTYPFAGFIKEEALQTLDFAIKEARASGDTAGEQQALDFQKELLNPDAWATVIGAVPYANLQAELKAFFEAAAIKVAINQRSLDKRLLDIEEGFVPTEFTEAQRKEMTEFLIERDRQRSIAKGFDPKPIDFSQFNPPGRS